MDYQAFYAQLKQGTFAPVYLFEGEEEYGKESALAALRAALLKGPLAMMNESVLTAPQDSELIAVCETLPIMEEKRLVIVKESQHLMGRGKAKQEETEDQEDLEEEALPRSDSLTPYMERLPGTVCLVFFMRGKANASRRLYKKIKDLGGLVSFDPLNQERLTRWIIREFGNHGLKAGREAAEHLAFAAGRELMLLKNEIAKIAASAPESKEIKKEDINRIATFNLEYKVFDLSDKVADGKAALALPLLAEMLRGGEQRLMLLALLQRHYRLLLMARILMDSRASQASMAGSLGVPPFVVRKLCQTAQGYSGEALRDAYLRCIEQEFLVKSGQIGEDGSLETLVLALLQIKKESGNQRV